MTLSNFSVLNSHLIWQVAIFYATTVEFSSILFSNVSMVNVTGGDGYFASSALEASGFEESTFFNLSSNNLQSFYLVADATNVTFSGDLMFVNATTDGCLAVIGCPSALNNVYFNANIQSDSPSLIAPSSAASSYDCLYYVQGVPMEVHYTKWIAVPPSKPIIWIVFGSCGGLLLVTLILAGVFYWKMGKTTTLYTAVQ